MELSLNALVEQLDELFFERATREWRLAAGVQRDLPEVPELPELVRLDAWQVLSELLDSPRLDDAKRGRLVLLRRHVARAFVEARVLEPQRRVADFLGGHTFFSAARTWTPAEALRELPRLAARESRVTLAAELSQQLQHHESAFARRLDGTLEAIAALKLTPDGFVAELHGRALAPRLEAAAKVLTDTRDAHADLLGYGLKKLDPLLTARVAQDHDAERVSLAPWLFESFRREDLSHAVSRCLGDLGLSPNADGRITVDTESRPGRDVRARCVELRVPDQVRLLLTPDLGFEAYAGWLSSWGMALHRANVGRALPFVERRLGDRAVIDAVGLVFESFLLEEGWLKRYLRLTASQAREAARAFAFRQLHRLRRTAALALYAQQATGRGASAQLTDDFVPRLSAAVGVEVPRGASLMAVDAFGDRALELDAFALAFAMRQELLERFNEDFWRNPATGRWLLGLASAGQRDDAVAVCKQTTGAPELPLAQAAGHRVLVMGA